MCLSFQPFKKKKKHATGQKYSHVNMHCFSSSPGLILRSLCKEGRGRRIDLSRRMERPGGISFQSYSGKAATERREGSWQSLGGQEFGKKEKKGRAWGAVVIVWNFKEERVGRILKKRSYHALYFVINPFAVSSREPW